MDMYFVSDIKEEMRKMKKIRKNVICNRHMIRKVKMGYEWYCWKCEEEKVKMLHEINHPLEFSFKKFADAVKDKTNRNIERDEN